MKINPEKLLFFLVFLLPFVIFPFGLSYYEIPKIMVFFAAVELLAVVFIWQKTKLLISPLGKIFLGGIVGLTVIHLFLFSPTEVLIADPYRFSGVFLLWHLLAIAIIGASRQLTLNRKLVIILSLVLGLTTLFLGRNPAGRFIGTLGEPNSLMGTYVYFWPFLSQVVNVVFGLGAAFLGLIFTGSRSGIIAVLLQISVLGLIQFIGWKKKIILVVIAGYLGLALTLPFFEPPKIYQDRAAIWKTTFATAQKSGMFGVGFGNIPRAINKEAVLNDSTVKNEYIDTTHNIFLDWYLQGGIAGLGLFIGIVTVAFWGLLSERKKTELVAGVGFLAMLCFNPLNISCQAAFWWLIGRGVTTK